MKRALRRFNNRKYKRNPKGWTGCKCSYCRANLTHKNDVREEQANEQLKELPL